MAQQTASIAMRQAAQYLRMSTEHQTYSLTFQRAHNAAFALEHDYELVREYVDAGASGLRLRGREGLRDLLAEAISGDAAFDAVLVYDVSRWGRFQDPDEAAHYEFLCRAAGVQVVYTAEPFTADGGLSSAIVKQLKRAMAAEYSRELSAKIQRAQRGLLSQGFWQGGPPGYGFRRVALPRLGGAPVRMEAGEQKALHGARTVLVAGPHAETETVRRIFRDFVTGGARPRTISERLNAEGVAAEGGAAWSAHRVRQVLRNEKYAGVLVGGKSENTLGARRIRRREEWTRAPGAVEPLVSRTTFEAAQAQFRRPKAPNLPDEVLLGELRRVLRDAGRLSAEVIARRPAAHCADVYRKRFGGLIGAYRRLGLQPTRKQIQAAESGRIHRPWTYRARTPWIDPDAAWRGLEAHLARRGAVTCRSIAEDPELPSVEWYRAHFGPMDEIYRRLGHVPNLRQRRSLAARRSRLDETRPLRG